MSGTKPNRGSGNPGRWNRGQHRGHPAHNSQSSTSEGISNIHQDNNPQNRGRGARGRFIYRGHPKQNQRATPQTVSISWGSQSEEFEVIPRTPQSGYQQPKGYMPGPFSQMSLPRHHSEMGFANCANAGQAERVTSHQPVQRMRQNSEKSGQFVYKRSKPNTFWKQRRKKKKEQPQNSLLNFARSDSKPSAAMSSDSEPESVLSRASSVADVRSADSSDEGSVQELNTTSPTEEDFEFINDLSFQNITHSYHQQQSQQEQGETYISVFWDIENCAVPHNKSAVDIVKKIRDTFYQKHTEDAFYVACDTKNMSEIIFKELDESNVTVIHASILNKNAADEKLKKFLHAFQQKYRRKGCAVVLLSGDSDFSTDLMEMRYRHHVNVNLVYMRNTRKALIAAAHNSVPYEIFLEDILDRGGKESLQFSLLVSRFPPSISTISGKTLLSSQLKSFNSRLEIRKKEPLEILLTFPNECVCQKAMKILKDFEIHDTKLKVEQTVSAIKSSTPLTSGNVLHMPDASQLLQIGKDSVEATKTTSCNVRIKEIPKLVNDEKDLSNISKEEVQIKKPLQLHLQNLLAPQKQEVMMKDATLLLSVTTRLGDAHYWQKELEQILKSKEISVQASGNTDIIYVKFKSVSHAKTANKELLKRQKLNQIVNYRVLELIRGDNDSKNVVTKHYNANDIANQKLEETIQQVQLRKFKVLEEYQCNVKSLKEKHSTSAITGEASGFQEKLIELNEQKVTFLGFTEKLCKNLKEMNITEVDLDEKIKDLLIDYSQECSCFRLGLPVYAKKSKIIQKIMSNNVTIIQAETGSGKSTQLCQYLLREGFGEKGLIICTQPRKIAALSLAKHVSTQVGCSVGGTVGYQVGLAAKKSAKTKVMFVTDFVMLKMCVENQQFSGISCIIIDEAHERSVYTDLLLGIVKNGLKLRPDLKVIITSATLKSDLFLDYFNLSPNALLQISGRLFPVEDIWLDYDVSIDWNYLDKSVETVYRLLDDQPGDVLTFLATPAETQRAMEKLNEKLKESNSKLKVSIFQLHGQLDTHEQEKVFQKTPKYGKKVVFSTNCAETSITIPGIRYVIDSGMVKEAHYDASRNLNSLAIGFVNKSSAEQRRGRAGRVQSGKCYRLYSKTNYKTNMAESSVPEILRVNLGQALLKLIKLGIVNPIAFDFVEPPPLSSLLKAMKQLLHLGAISEHTNKLTELGLKMATLPLEPRLCYLVAKAIENGIGYDGVVVAALATVSRNIFFRTNENKNEADIKKIEFCSEESDFLTYLEVYKEWSSVSKNKKSHWCVLNCINAKSMRASHDLILELLATLHHEFGTKIEAKFTNQESLPNLLHALIFQSFSENVCVFSGHIKLGYRSPDIEGNLYLHPSSSLTSLGKWRPNFIVYDCILETSRRFLLNITTVKEKFMDEALKSEQLQINWEEMTSKMLQHIKVGPFGDCVLKSFVGKKGSGLKNIEEWIRKKCSTEECILEADFSSGFISIFISPDCAVPAKKVVLRNTNTICTRLLEQEKEIKNLKDVTNTIAIFGSGAEVKEVILPGEYRAVIVKPPDHYTIQVKEQLSDCGKNWVISLKDSKKVFFSKFRSAQKAVEKFQEDKLVSVRPFISFESAVPSLFFKVLLHIARKNCVGKAFFSVVPETRFTEVSYVLRNKYWPYKSKNLTVTISKKCPTDFYIQNLPMVLNDAELRNYLNAQLPNGILISKLVVLRDKDFASSEQDTANMKSSIHSLFSRFTRRHIEINLKTPHVKDRHWQAIVYFENSQDGQMAVNVVKGRTQYCNDLGNQIVEMKPLLDAELFCNKNIFNSIKIEIEAALEFFKTVTNIGDKLDIKAFPKNETTVHITINSNNIADICDAKKAIQTLIDGDKIECCGNATLEKLFTERGKSLVQKLNSDIQNSHTYLDYRSKTVNVFGSETAKTVVKHEINLFLDRLAEEGFGQFLLKSSHSQRSILKTLLKMYGSDLNELKRIFHLSSAEINIYKHVLSISGKDAAISECRKKIADLLSELGECNSEKKVNAEECPVCFEEAIDPIYRLQYCGHAYCEECFLLQLQSDQIPITCCKQNCEQPLTLTDLGWAFEKNHALENRVHSRAFESFINKSTDFKCCPTPNCTMIYRIGPRGRDQRFTCSSCSNSICSSCGVLYHEGMSCDFYLHYKDDQDYSLKVWLNKDKENRKLCPKCKTPIEKNGGCNHVVCWKCQSHMCWLCLKTFAEGIDVYNHQPHCAAVHY